MLSEGHDISFTSCKELSLSIAQFYSDVTKLAIICSTSTRKVHLLKLCFFICEFPNFSTVEIWIGVDIYKEQDIYIYICIIKLAPIWQPNRDIMAYIKKQYIMENDESPLVLFSQMMKRLNSSSKGMLACHSF